MKKILFNTANLVAQFSGWKFQLERWMEEERKVIEGTDAKVFDRICHDIHAAGYDAMELWVAHCYPQALTSTQIRERRRIAEENGVRIVALAAPCTPANVKVAEVLGCESINGGMGGNSLSEIHSLIGSSSVVYNYESHSEKTAEQVLASIGGGSDRIGVALDTGWVGSNGTESCQTFVRKLGSLLRHIHVKDIAARGGHHTVPLGTGVVDLEPTIQEMKKQGYSGWWSWEDEPEDRNPWDIAAAMRQWIEQRI